MLAATPGVVQPDLENQAREAVVTSSEEQGHPQEAVVASAEEEPVQEAVVASAEEQEPEPLAVRVSVTSNVSEQYIFCFETPTPEERTESAVHHRRVLNNTGRCLCWLFPWSAKSTVGRQLRFHLGYSFLQLIVLTTIVVFDRSQLMLLLFNVFIALQAGLIFGAIRDAELFRAVGDLRRHQSDVKAKLWGLTSAAFLAPLWWCFDAIGTIKGPSRWSGSDPPPLDVGRLLISIFMFIHYTVIFAHFLYIARKSGRRLVQNMLRPTKLPAVRYDTVGGQREEDAACSICLGEYEAHEHVIVLPCGHIYHADCISTWVRKADLCPLRCDGAVLELPQSGKQQFGRWRPSSYRSGSSDNVLAQGGAQTEAGVVEEADAGRESQEAQDQGDAAPLPDADMAGPRIVALGEEDSGSPRSAVHASAEALPGRGLSPEPQILGAPVPADVFPDVSPHGAPREVTVHL